MNDAAQTDAWRMRQVEQVLAGELHTASENVRLANLHLHDITDPIPSGALWPDSKLEIQQARTACTRAHETWLKATNRWVAFVKDGTIPEDLNP